MPSASAEDETTSAAPAPIIESKVRRSRKTTVRAASGVTTGNTSTLLGILMTVMEEPALAGIDTELAMPIAVPINPKYSLRPPAATFGRRAVKPGRHRDPDL